ncbi:DNA ligase D [Flavobacterium sp. SM2513]|uniref:DNA ligase D n=1 Tax=Flavobacterium sp. SM2513 TaxID=3424766 RepID=UPI003D7F1E49
MSLAKYNQKRNFEQTDEPKGTKGKSANEFVFVVQKHAASHLHYDFRIQVGGVLKSWAVPKGPSMDPNDKRLAMLVEDHPYDYKDFEGTIPKGNYGAGTVIVWDKGRYELVNEGESAQNRLREDLEKGKISFVLKGEKLKGEFSLVKLKGKQENAWLLLKKKDAYATDKDILKKDKSVLTNRTLEALASASQKKTAQRKAKKKEVQLGFVAPMLAGGKKGTAFSNADYLFENKYDGYRCVAVVQEDQVSLWSRNEHSFTAQFEAVADELKNIKHAAVLDGELVVADANGKASFQLLQNYMQTGEGTLHYYVFDLLNLDGNDTTLLSLLERKELLKRLLQKYAFERVRYSEHVLENGRDLFEEAVRNKTEGILAKRIDGNYLVGRRSADWIKIKIIQQVAAVIIGITSPKHSRSYFGALLLGHYKNGTLEYIGKCGTGFTEAALQELHQKLTPYFVSERPISKKVSLKNDIQWVQPELVCQVKFTEWTRGGHLRHPVYLGLRVDKKPKEVVHQEQDSEEQKSAVLDAVSAETAPNYDLKLGKKTLHLTNQNKIYFPESGLTKGAVLEYYKAVAGSILPYLKNRPQSMHRFPNGITGSSFYQKDVDLAAVPKWLKTVPIPSASTDKELNYLICNDTATLLYMANLGCIDFNPWNSTTKKLDNPDWMVIDIDPEKDDFKLVVEVALMVKTVMDELDTPCYCKTSGASGLHVYVPLAAKYRYESVLLFAELIAREVHFRLPQTTTLERSIKKRNHKIYIDYLQNRKGQTLAAPYSIRPRIGATVSTPLQWEEVTKELHPSQFTLKNVLERFAEKGDLWKPVLETGATIEELLAKLEALKKT